MENMSITTLEAYDDYELPMPTAGTEKQIWYAQDIIAYPIKLCYTMIDIEFSRMGNKLNRECHLWSRAASKYADWCHKLAENAGDKFEAGKIIDMKERFIKTAKGCVQLAAQEMGYDKFKTHEFVANMR